MPMEVFVFSFLTRNTSNDEVDCVTEFQGNSISEVVSQAINWIDEQFDNE